MILERYERCKECDHRIPVYGREMSWLGCGILNDGRFVGTIKNCPLYEKFKKSKRKGGCGNCDTNTER